MTYKISGIDIGILAIRLMGKYYLATETFGYTGLGMLMVVIWVLCLGVGFCEDFDKILEAVFLYVGHPFAWTWMR